MANPGDASLEANTGAYGASSAPAIPIPRVIIQQVRSMISDYPQTNELFVGEENSDIKIARYIYDTVEDWNATIPILRYKPTPMDFVTNTNLAPARAIIQLGAAAAILRSTVVKLARNDLPYTAGNVTAQPNAVWRNLEPLIQDMRNEYEQKKTYFKKAMNVSSSYGDGGYRVAHTEHFAGIHSEALFLTL